MASRFAVQPIPRPRTASGVATIMEVAQVLIAVPSARPAKQTSEEQDHHGEAASSTMATRTNVAEVIRCSVVLILTFSK